MATQANIDMAQQLYVAYYGRPADKAGLDYWAEEIEADSAGGATNAFGNSAEFEARFGDLSEEELINNLYNQMFGRDAEPAGSDYWVGVLGSGEKSLAEIALTISNAARNEDKQALQNKVAVANNFTAAIDTPDEIEAYQGNDAADEARNLLSTVGADTDPESVDVDAALQALVDSANPNPGETFTFTDSVGEVLSGTEGDDTFDGISPDTINEGDSIDGKGGDDTLNILAASTADLPIDFATTNVEKVFITSGFRLGGVDASVFGGVEELWQANSASAVTELAETTTAGFSGFAGGTMNVAAADTAAAASIALELSGTGLPPILNVSGAALNSVVVSGTLADGDEDGEVDALELNVTAGDDQQTLNIDASAMTGRLDYTNVAGTEESITLGDDNGSDTLNVEGGSTYGSMDVITNFDSTVDEDPNAEGADVTADTLTGITGQYTQVDVSSATDLVGAFTAAALDGDAASGVSFQFEDNTYAFSSADDLNDDSDFAIQIMGIHDLSADNAAYAA